MPFRRDLQSMLQYEASRSPDIAEMIANVDEMSDADIDAANVKLPWMRQALRELRNRNIGQRTANSLEPFIVDGRSPDPMGETRRWMWDAQYISVGRTLLEIRPGQLIWFSERGVWIDTIYTEVIDPILRIRTETCGQMTRSAYNQAVRDLMNKNSFKEAGITSQKPAYTIYRS